MKKTLPLIILYFVTGFISAKSIFTTQRLEKIKYKGIEYSFYSLPLEPYFEKYPEKRPEATSSALWRGYIGYYEIIENQLFLIDIKRVELCTDSPGNFEKQWISIYGEIFPCTDKKKIDWFTEILILPNDESISYQYQGYYSNHSEYWLIELEKGELNESRKYNHKEFAKFRKRQFEIFEKTDGFRKEFSNFIENNKDSDPKNLKSYFSNSILSYTPKFLTE